MKHGANGKWYMNAKNYIRETAVEVNSHEYLEDLWGNMERAYSRKVHGLFDLKWVSKHVNTPFLGRFLKWYANRGFIKNGREHKLNLEAAQGHFGQIITLKETKEIILEKTEEIVRAICPCKFFNRGIKEATCLGFTPLKEILPKLPRFIPENGLEILDKEKAVSFLESMSEKGYVHSIWAGPLPAIVAVCSCDLPTCGAIRLRTDFDINACWKGHYVATVNLDKCIQCGNCNDICQFDALSYDPNKGPRIDLEKCYGCSNCAEMCLENAIQLVERDSIPITRGKY
jgi:formate hydrogenlyase subunit 6/NADH:ubiquinone oxidoreductase subunit I